MPTVSSSPFRRGRVAHLRTGPWIRLISDQAAPIVGFLPPLDPSEQLRLQRKYVLDGPAVASECLLHVDTSVDIVATWSSSGTQLRGLLSRHSGVLSGPIEGLLEGAIPAGNALGALTLQLAVTLRNGKALEASAASALGSILISEVTEVRIEDDLSRFPIETIDFSKHRWADKGAGWLLAWAESDLHSPLARALTLFINAGNAAVVSAATGAATPEGACIRQAIKFDLVRSVLTKYVLRDDFHEEIGSHPSDSVGRTAQDLAELHFGNFSLSELRALIENQPDVYSMMLQARLQLFGRLS